MSLYQAISVYTYYMNHGYLVYIFCAYITLNLGLQKFAVHMPLALGTEHMHCKLPLVSVQVVYTLNTPRNHDLYIYYI